MLYFATPHPNTHQLMRDKKLGWLDTPDQCSQGKRPPGIIWAADNGAFGKAFDESRWWNWLETCDGINECVFATAPDVVGDHHATLARAQPYLPRIRALGYPAAFVIQDGADTSNVPWDDFDALFIGGSDSFKLGSVASQIVAEAKRRDKWVHCGRVNSYKRAQWANTIGCDSVDGTYLKFGPNINLPKLMSWMERIHGQLPLFEVDA